jgi:hypothetical protein
MLTAMQRFFERLFPKRRETVEITVETDESWEVSVFRRIQVRQFCPYCRTESEFVPAALAERIIAADEETVAGLIADGSFHLTDDAAGGQSLLCLNSLKDGFERSEKKLVRPGEKKSER